MADNLREILDIAKRAMPDIPADVWAHIEGEIRLNFGGQRPYIAAKRKRHQLEVLADMGANQSIDRVATILGVSVRTVQRLKSLGRE